MARLVIVINTPHSIADLNGKIQNSGNAHEACNNVADYIRGVKSGAVSGGVTVQVTTRDSDPSVGTSGSGSTQVTYTLS